MLNNVYKKIFRAVLFVGSNYLSVKDWLNILWCINKGILYGLYREPGNANCLNPGGAVVRTQHFHCQGLSLISGQGAKIPQATRYGIYVYIYMFNWMKKGKFKTSWLVCNTHTPQYLYSRSLECLWKNTQGTEQGHFWAREPGTKGQRSEEDYFYWKFYSRACLMFQKAWGYHL